MWPTMECLAPLNLGEVGMGYESGGGVGMVSWRQGGVCP